MYPRASRPLISLVATLRTMGVAAVALTLADCGHGSTTTAVSTNYTVGGTISGLTVSSVVLANGTATVSIPAGATSWLFPTSFVAGSSYSVTVKTQPTGELCEVTSGASGMNTGSVGNVTVACGFGQWTWDGGPNTANASGVYGTQGSAAAGNLPGARYDASSWTDSSGDFWLFGGIGYDSSGVTGYLNDLWRYSPSTGLWTWVGGGNLANASGLYGTLGTAAAGNVPGARQAASSWIDSSGNLWLFGGVGYDSSGAVADLNDLWQYSPSTGLWTWVGGGNLANASGLYGTLGTAAAGNVPGARYSASSWMDASGNLWLFGGAGYDSTGAVGNLNDLWRYAPSTGQWTWVSGGMVTMPAGSTARRAPPRPATCRERAIPPARGSTPPAICGCSAAMATTRPARTAVWASSTICGNTVRAADSGPGSMARTRPMPSGVTARWESLQPLTCRERARQPIPGSTRPATCGCSAGSAMTRPVLLGNLNDLWKFAPSTAAWTWVSGGFGDNTAGSYGTQGSAQVSTQPGGRNSDSSWIDTSGNLWLFGGYGYDSAATLGYLSDLWQYNPGSGG